MTGETAEGVLKIFLIADNRLLREAIAKLLARKGTLQIVGAAPFSPAILEQIIACETNVLLMDSIPVPVWRIEFIREAIRSIAGLKVVMIGMEVDEEMFLRSIKAGAIGYVLKDASAMEMDAAVRSAARDEAVCPPRLCSFLFEYVSRQSLLTPNLSVKARAELSRREQQLIPLIARGLTNKEIASQLSISEQTVKNHIHRMLRKLGVEDRLGVVESATEMPALPLKIV